MLTTEAAALKLWCPLSRVANGGNRDPSGGPMTDQNRTNCIGARCMLWRWYDPAANAEAPRGYCGSGGAPGSGSFA